MDDSAYNELPEDYVLDIVNVRDSLFKMDGTMREPFLTMDGVHYFENGYRVKQLFERADAVNEDIMGIEYHVAQMYDLSAYTDSYEINGMGVTELFHRAGSNEYYFLHIDEEFYYDLYHISLDM